MNKQLFPFFLIMLFPFFIIAQNDTIIKIDSIVSTFESREVNLEQQRIMLDSSLVEKIISIGIEKDDYWYCAVGYYIKSTGRIRINRIRLLTKSLDYINKIKYNHKEINKFTTLSLQEYFELFYQQFYNSDNTRSIENAFKAIELAGVFRDTNIMTRANHIIAMNYRNVDEFKNSVIYLKKEIELCSYKRKSEFATSLNELANAYYFLNKIDSSIIVREEALIIAKEIEDDPRIRAYIYHDMANIQCQNQNAYKEGLKNFRKSLNLIKGVASVRELMIIKFNIAMCLINLDRADSANRILTPLISIAQHEGLNLELSEIYSLLTKSYSQENNYKKAFEYQRLYQQIKDTLFTINKLKEINHIEAKYQQSLHQKELEKLHLERKMQKQRMKGLRIAILLILVSFIIIVYVLIKKWKSERMVNQQKELVYKKEKALVEANLEKEKILQKELQKENQYKSKQLTTHALNMLQKNILLQEMDEELKICLPRMDDKLKKSLNSIRRQIKRNMSTEKDWHLFKLYFEEVNKNFLQKIQDRSDQITNNDMRLAALIKLNLNIKEAASVLNIEPDSLKKARYRLRQKLNLDKNESLSEFINNIV